MVNKLVYPYIIGAHMSLGKLPQPIGSSINSWSDNAFRARTWSWWWKAKFYSNGRKSPKRGQEKYGTSCISFSAIKGINTLKKWKVSIMVIQYKQLIFLQCLSRKNKKYQQFKNRNKVTYIEDLAYITMIKNMYIT